jgi:hypothetical protein
LTADYADNTDGEGEEWLLIIRLNPRNPRSNSSLRIFLNPQKAASPHLLAQGGDDENLCETAP